MAVTLGAIPSLHDHRNPCESEMSELIFLVEEAPEGGFCARALGQSIFTEADNLEDLRQQVRDAVHCHFEAGHAPGIIRLHFVREGVLTV